jgi:regulator of protease activity HflC (stomatin/prohibitin superfamily)
MKYQCKNCKRTREFYDDEEPTCVCGNADFVKYKEPISDGLKMTIAIAILVFGLIILFGSFYTIGAGERGVLTTFGKPSMEPKGEGLHFKMPIIQGVKKMDVRTQKIETDADSVTKDLQGVMTRVALNYHINPVNVPNLYQEIGKDYQETVIDPSIQEAVKAVMAKYKVEEITDRRPEVSRDIKEFLTERLSKYHILIDDFNVINFAWSEEFSKSIEDKLTAEQKKLKAEMDLERIKVEAQQKIAQAGAEAESLRLQKQEITPDLIELRKIEAQIKAIDKWDGIMPKVTGGATPFVGIDIESSQKVAE